MSSPRPWIQLYLSTCLALMLSAGILLGLNLRRVEIQGMYGALLETKEAYIASSEKSSSLGIYGWPQPMYGNAKHRHIGEVMETDKGEVFIKDQGTGDWKDFSLGWNTEGILVNAYAWIALLLAVVLIFEWRQRGIPWQLLRLRRDKQIALACALGILLWLNRIEDYGQYLARGWPLRFYYYGSNLPGMGMPEAPGLHLGWLLMDLTAALLILILFGWVSGKFFARKAKNSAAPSGSVTT